MMPFLTQFANTAASAEEEITNGGLFASIGIDWKLLLLQSVAFLLLLLILKKFVYPPLLKMLDNYERNIKEAREAANVTKQQADQAQVEVDKMLKVARKEAGEIVMSAKDEAVALVETADKRSKERSERLVQTAREDIQKEVLAAKKALRDETLDLIVDATEKVVGRNLSEITDKKVISSTLNEVSK